MDTACWLVGGETLFGGSLRGIGHFRGNAALRAESPVAADLATRARAAD